MDGVVAAFGLAVNIITLIEITFTITRTQENIGKATSIPRALGPTLECLPAITGHLEYLKHQQLPLPKQDVANVRDIILGWNYFVADLAEEIKKVVPVQSDPRRQLQQKAVCSLERTQQINLAAVGVTGCRIICQQNFRS